MGVDITAKLLPNPLTMITQLVATLVIFLLYRKFLHQTVLDYLDRRKAKMDQDFNAADEAKIHADVMVAETKQQYQESYQELALLRKQLVEEAESEKRLIIAKAQQEVTDLKNRQAQSLDMERKKLYQEVEQHILEVATQINQKVLADIEYNEDEVLQALAKEINNNDYQH